MNFQEEFRRAITRRHFFGRGAKGLGVLALASLLDQGLFSAGGTAMQSRGRVNPLHYRPRAKNIIYLFMAGGPSQLDLFDYKPELAQRSGEPMPESFTAGQRIAQLRGMKLTCRGTEFKFQRHGRSGAEISELLPYTAEIADEIAIVRSMQTDAINHDPAVTLMQTGSEQPGRPTVGAWVSYGLGSENANLPAFVALLSGHPQAGPLPSRFWGSGFLPSSHQGVPFRSQGEPILFVSNPPGIDSKIRRWVLDGVQELNQLKYSGVGDPEILARIEAFEMAYRMQTSVPELMDIQKEPPEVLELYGAEPGKASFANNCLLARRLVERGVRFVQLYHRGWDHHGDLPTRLPWECQKTDRAAAALVKDLKTRGLLEETLVIWGGEFGRTPMNQGAAAGDAYGRDHHMKAFTMWMAGGGMKSGITLGSTDELGYSVVEDPLHVNDFHATVLHCLGVHHEKLTYRFQGREFRLTDVGGKVVEKLLA